FPPVLIGAALGALITVILFWLKNVREEEVSRSNEFASEIRALAGDGARYWLLAAGDEKQLLELKILGGQTFLDGYTALICRRYSGSQESALRGELSLFYEALSGGNFGSDDVAADSSKSLMCQMSAARTAVVLKETA